MRCRCRPASIDDVYPLSPMQQGMLFHSLYEPDSRRLHQPDAPRRRRPRRRAFPAGLASGAWMPTTSCAAVSSGRAMLAQPVQVVRRARADAVQRARLARPRLIRRGAGALADDERCQGFDLTGAPLLRLVLVRTATDAAPDLHQSSHPAWTAGATRSCSAKCCSAMPAQTPAVGAGVIAITSTGCSVRTAGQSSISGRQQLADLARADAAGQRACRRRRAAQGSGHDRSPDTGCQRTQALEATLPASRKSPSTPWCKRRGCCCCSATPASDSVAFGATVAGRPADLPGIEQQIGLFINTLPVIAAPRRDRSVGQWLQAGAGAEPEPARARTHAAGSTFSVGPGRAVKRCSTTFWCSKTTRWPKR